MRQSHARRREWSFPASTEARIFLLWLPLLALRLDPPARGGLG